MRLSTEQTRQITRTVSQLTGGSADVYVFGSRLDDTARGGDIDRLLESAAPIASTPAAVGAGLPAIARQSDARGIAGKPAPTGRFNHPGNKHE